MDTHKTAFILAASLKQTPSAAVTLLPVPRRSLCPGSGRYVCHGGPGSGEQEVGPTCPPLQQDAGHLHVFI